MIVLIVFEDYLVALPRREMPYLELSLSNLIPALYNEDKDSILDKDKDKDKDRDKN